MLIIVILIVIAVAIAWFYQATQPPKPDALPAAVRAPAAHGLGIAFLASGKLFFQADGAAPREIDSPYVRDIEARQARSNERNAWKKDTSFQIGAGGQLRQFAADARPMQTSSVQFDGAGKLYYFLCDRGIGGLFSYDLASGAELRLVHRQHLDLSDLRLDPVSRRFVCATVSRDGISNIATLDGEGNQYRELTAGDTADSAPCWVPGEPDRILFQSAGLARNEHGHIVAQANSTIQALNLKSGAIDAILDDPRYDFLNPRVDGEGRLLFIRRPYETAHYAFGTFITDVLLFPFRLLRAVFHFLNFFSLMYSRKPLTGASGPAVRADIKDIVLKGKRIDAEKALRSESMVAGVPSLVPQSWQLVRRERDGAEQVLATNVGSYDLTAEDRIVYSNGRAVFEVQQGAAPRLLLRSDLIGDVVATAA